MLPKIALLLAIFSAATTVCIVVARTENIGPFFPAVMTMLYIIGPYGVLGLLAWFKRSHRAVSVIVFLVTLTLACFGIAVFAVDCYHFYTDPQHRIGQTWIPFLVPFAQWLVAICLACGVLAFSCFSFRRGKK